MKKNILLFFIFSIFFNLNTKAQSSAHTDKNGLTWYSYLEEARIISKEKNKPIFAFFTGSDWCGWCMKLQKDVISKPDFIEWAKENVVLLELDFPRKKQLSADLVEQNNGLQQALGIRGYPTVWLLFAEKNETTGATNLVTIGSLGYPQGATPGKEETKFLSDANFMLENFDK